MKLKTAMVDGCVHARGVCIDEQPNNSQVADLEHDAACAHALVKAIDESAQIDPVDAVTFIRARADELLREWGIEP